MSHAILANNAVHLQYSSTEEAPYRWHQLVSLQCPGIISPVSSAQARNCTAKSGYTVPGGEGATLSDGRPRKDAQGLAAMRAALPESTHVVVPAFALGSPLPRLCCSWTILQAAGRKQDSKDHRRGQNEVSQVTTEIATPSSLATKQGAAEERHA